MVRLHMVYYEIVYSFRFNTHFLKAIIEGIRDSIPADNTVYYGSLFPLNYVGV